MASFKASHVGCHIVPYRCGIVYGMIWRLTGVASCWALHGVTRPRLWCSIRSEMALYVVSKQYVVVYAVESGWNVASLSDGVVYSVSIEMSSYMASMWRSTWRLTVRRGVWRHME